MSYANSKNELENKIKIAIKAALLTQAEQTIRNMRDADGNKPYASPGNFNAYMATPIDNSSPDPRTIGDEVEASAEKGAILYSELAEPVVQVMFDKLVEHVEVQVADYVTALKNVFSVWVPVPTDGGTSLKTMVNAITAPITKKIKIPN